MKKIDFYGHSEKQQILIYLMSKNCRP